ncbi:MAG: hypothetical protein OXF06_01075 [Bacteroidetes bacterium]|nr:hypothetical protein [Bacteroidota bacterium]
MAIVKNDTLHKYWVQCRNSQLIYLKIANSTGLMEKHPFEVIFGFPYPTHPFWGRKAFLPYA